MQNGKENRSYFQEIGNYYDPQATEGNINNELAKEDMIFHHHSGICQPNELFPELSELDLIKLLHAQENALTKRGMEFLDEISPEMTGFDAGCGRGGSSIMFAKTYNNKMFGVTLSYKQANFANYASSKLGLQNLVGFTQANMLETPFDSNKFDFIWACESTEHIPDLNDMFSEFDRVAKQKSKLVIIAACGVPEHPKGPEYIKLANDWYHMRVHSRKEYLESAKRNNWQLTNDVDLTQETIPYWDLRTRSQYKTGVEKLSEGYKIGAGEYRLYSFKKY